MRVLAGCLFGLFLITSCTSTEETDTPVQQRSIRITATTSIVADLARSIGGSEVIVESLMGPGVDPHLYKASARDVSRIQEADILVYNGLHLEGKMGDIFEDRKESGSPAIAIAEAGVPDSLLLESDTYQGNFDPHIWFDAELWIRAGYALAIALGELDSTRKNIFSVRATEYEDKLMEVDVYVHNRVSEIPEEKRVLITSHDAFGYFGKAYGFEVRGLQGISTVTEAGAADIQNLAQMVAERRIPAMFVESSVSPRGIQAVREAVRDREFDVSIGGTLYGDALGGEATSAATYSGMVRHNIDTIVQALSNDKGS